MANTTNLNLVKPAGTDKALVSALNSNSDKIDAWAGTTNQAIANKPSNATQMPMSGSDATTVASAISTLNSKLNKFKLHTQSVTTNSTGSAMLSLTTSKIILGGTLDKDGHLRFDTYNGNWWVSDLTANTAYTVTVMYYEE